MLIIGSHVSFNKEKQLIGSLDEALSYESNTFMFYTGAPQNTRRYEINDNLTNQALEKMKNNNIDINNIIVHAPYIINLANTVKPETFELAVDFLNLEMERTEAMGCRTLILHPGAHVGAGENAGIHQIVKGLNEVLGQKGNVNIALETMAGKGTEMGRSFEELARIYDGVVHNERLRVCFDTCHTNDSGYDVRNHFDEVLEQFDRLIGCDQIAVFHINDSKNPKGTHKDRHENVGFGTIGYESLRNIVYHEGFESVPKILESPYIPDPETKKRAFAPYKHEIAMLREGRFHENLKEEILAASRG